MNGSSTGLAENHTVWHSEMSLPLIAICISLGSLLVAGLSLGWNIYRDVVRKPRLHVSIMHGIAVVAPTKQSDPRIFVTITNYGPNKTKACMLRLRKTSWWRRILRRERYAVLIPDYEDTLSGRLPAELDVGDTVDLSFRIRPELFIRHNFSHIGITDPFGRVYWCSRKAYRYTARQLRAEENKKRPNKAVGPTPLA